jgi:hypothetical protein
MAGADDRNPLHHTRNMQQRLSETIDHLRRDIAKVDEPQLKAMFETSAEVLAGLVKAFRDYEQKNGVFVKSCGWILPQNSGERPVDRRFVHVRRCSEIARESGMITLGDWLRARGADPEHFSEAAAFG